jgi:RNA polymerase-interacting CarD/CdnL/TRCF family regulator
MRFEVDDQIVHPQHGVGRVVKLENRQIGPAAPCLYYEISLSRGTLWVQVDDPPRGLRRLTAKGELPHYRGILKGRPVALSKDYRQRQLDLSERLKEGSFRARCEIVRDLSAQRWVKPLSEGSAVLFRAAHGMVHEEWAAAAQVTLAQAAQEIEELLLEGRKRYSV